MVQINLFRERYTNKQTIGTITVRKNNQFVGGFVSLEKSDLNNQRSISCIPIGTYDIEHWDSDKHPNSFHVKNVKDRDYILIHSGTYFTHTEGCILVGGLLSDINNDGYLDILHSKEAMELLNNICKDEKDIKLIIS